jgi:abortive infection bacteriophage resistance protein
MLVNVMDFGLMLTLYKGASVDIRSKLAKDLGVSAKVLESWLVTINTVRNICAHHGRLWNKRLGTEPKIPKNSKDMRWHDFTFVKPNRIAGVLTILNYLLEYIAPDTHWRDRLWKLIGNQDEKTLEKMGFIKGWEMSLFWKYVTNEGSCVANTMQVG